MSVDLVEYTIEFCELSWQWLNDKEIKNMINAPDISKQQQIKWFNELKMRQDYLIWGILFDRKPLGACGLKNLSDFDCEYWGYIGEKTYWGRGIGVDVFNKVSEKATILGLQSIWLKVIKENRRAVNLYLKLGFYFEKSDDELLLMRKQL